jgi:hypothetical protein
MDSPLVWVSIVLVLLWAALSLGWLLIRRSVQADLRRARERFPQDRPELERLFFQAASASGKPRGLRWKECQWNDLVAWARDRKTGQLLVLVGITIAFEAIEGGDMEGVEAVGNLRNASAVFFWQDGRWQTAGRAIFNLNPDEAVQHFKDGYAAVE